MTIADAAEARHAVVAAANRLAVDDAGASAEPDQRLYDQAKAVGQVVAGAAVEANAAAILAGDNPKTIVLDFMQPCRPGRRLLRFNGQTGRDKSGGQSAHIHGPLIAGGPRLGQARVSPNRVCLVLWECFTCCSAETMNAETPDFNQCTMRWRSLLWQPILFQLRWNRSLILGFIVTAPVAHWRAATVHKPDRFPLAPELLDGQNLVDAVCWTTAGRLSP